MSTQAISREELDSRTSGVAEGDAAVRGAEAALRNAQLNLEWTTVRAPISGRVGRAEITAGNLVQAGPPSPSLLTTIVSLDPIYVYFDSRRAGVPQVRRRARRTQRVAPVQIGLANETGFPHEGTLDFVDNRRRSERRHDSRARRPAQSQPCCSRRACSPACGSPAASAAPSTMVQDQAIGTDQDRKFVLVLKPDSTRRVSRRDARPSRRRAARRADRDSSRARTSSSTDCCAYGPGMKVAAKSGDDARARTARRTRATAAQ